MTPRQAFESWVSQHAVRLFAYAVALGITWGLLTAEVRTLDKQKADKADVDAIGAKVDALYYFACRDPQNAHDSRCRPSRSPGE